MDNDEQNRAKILCAMEKRAKKLKQWLAERTPEQLSNTCIGNPGCFKLPGIPMPPPEYNGFDIVVNDE